MLQEILTVTGVSVEQAVMIGDSSYDLEMAQRLGMPRIGWAMECTRSKFYNSSNL